MGSAANGAKSGIISGIVYGLLLAIVTYFTLLSIKGTAIAAITKALPTDSPFTADQLYSIALLLSPAISLIIGVLGGLVLGAIYGSLFEKIPGRKPVVRGLIFGLVLWLLSSILGGLNDLGTGSDTTRSRRSPGWPRR